MGILSKASELQDAGSFVFGRTASGKSHYVVGALVTQKITKVLWLYANNAGALVGNEATKDWTVGRVDSLADLKTILTEIRSEEDRPDAIVLDGIDSLRDFALVKAQAESSKPEVLKQSDWGDAGHLLDYNLRQLRGLCDVLYGICDVYEDELTGIWKVALNPHSLAIVNRLFGTKTLVYTGRNSETKNMEYNSVSGELAVRLKPLN